MIFGLPPIDVPDDAVEQPDTGAAESAGSRQGRPRPRVIPRWLVVPIVAGLVAAGPIGLLVATSLAAAFVVLRLRLLASDPEIPALPPFPWRRRPPVAVLPGFTRTVGSVEWGLASAYDFDAALRPRLTRVAAARLLDRAGIDLYAEPDRAAAALGSDAWTLLDPSRPGVADRTVPGPDRARLVRVLEAIERI